MAKGHHPEGQDSVDDGCLAVTVGVVGRTAKFLGCIVAAACREWGRGQHPTRHRPYGGLGLALPWMDSPVPATFVAAFMLHLAWAA
ncbi:hypothetical protein ADIAG_00681 [Paeniglutamicibacter gangotriensis Lz1y]|uniref:Uncharacterized protein n=1 Tax=Paeniglutamicibacter gangotriensis Lz1y TaxID=1276920 RepID=M7MWZ0_9MICC|nr:hypothetical protein ADIAG_00681 [Paeniglutamicibacter gangotriensis Lz1y]